MRNNKTPRKNLPILRPTKKRADNDDIWHNNGRQKTMNTIDNNYNKYNIDNRFLKEPA